MVDSLSRGMQQRLGVARVLVHDPKVLLLDEPASGLDPRARIEMRALLTELRRMGKTIIVSSHILSELAEMCTSIGIIERGRLLYAGRIEDAFAQAARGAGERISLRLEPDPRGLEPARAALAHDNRVASARIEDPDKNELVVELTPVAPQSPIDPATPASNGVHGHHFLIQAIIAAGYRIVSFTPREHKLEDVFLRLTQGQVQ
jgi:ABC-2 type transport system ATP-binding protein